MTTARAYVVTPDDAPGFWQLGNLWRVMASGILTGNSFCLIDQLVTPKGGGPCTHAHTQDEGLYIISGHCTFQADGLTLPAGPGTFVAVPRHAQHSFVVDAPGTQLLNFYLPAGFELLLMGFAHPAERNELPPPGVALPPRRLVEQLSRDYGQIPILGLPGADPPGPDNMSTKPTPGATETSFIATAAMSPAYWHAGGLWTVLADATATGGRYCLFERLMRAGQSDAPHIHLDSDEVFYVLDGAAEFLLDDRILHASKGALVFIPRGTVHAVCVDGKGAQMLNLYTQAGFQRWVSALGSAAGARTLPTQGWMPPDVGKERRALLSAELGLRELAVTSPFVAA